MKRWIAFASAHFECIFLAYLWLSASVLAAIAGRPALGAIGAITVLPFLVAYVWVVRARAR